MRLSRWLYYLSSMPTLALGIANWPAIFAALVTRARRPFVIRLRNGSQYKARTLMDVWIIKETVLDRGYEKASVPLQDGWTILDIGGGLGDFTVDAARKNPHGMVYVYEPFPESFALLKENAALNGVQNFRAFPVAVAGAPGVVTLDTSTAEAVLHSTARHAVPRSVIEVEAVTLDQVFEQLGLETCHFLKMDCEGAEYEIFFNASPDTLRKIRHICLEYHDHIGSHSHQTLVEFLEGAGFVVRLNPSPVHPFLGLLHARNVEEESA